MKGIDVERVVEDAARAADVKAAKRLLSDLCERLENVTGLMISLMRALDGPPGAITELADFWFAPAERIVPVSFPGQGPQERCLTAPGWLPAVRESAQQPDLLGCAGLGGPSGRDSSRVGDAVPAADLPRPDRHQPSCPSCPSCLVLPRPLITSRTPPAISTAANTRGLRSLSASAFAVTAARIPFKSGAPSSRCAPRRCPCR